MKKVLMVSDLTQGGAAIACQRLNHAVRLHGEYASRWIAGTGSAEIANVVADEMPGVMETFFRRMVGRYRMRSGIRTVRLRYKVRRWCNDRDLFRSVMRGKPAPIVTLHNLHEFATFQFVEMLPADLSIVWVLQDMWPLTGYCCYSYDCEKYRDGCNGRCPQEGRWGIMPRSPSLEWQRRQRFYRKNADRIVFVGPSQWMLQKANLRFGGAIRSECISNCVDLGVFSPLSDRQAARAVLGLPANGDVLLFGAAGISERRKGFGKMLEAVDLLVTRMGRALTVVVFGAMGGEIKLPAGWLYAGVIRDERLLNLYYNSADAFVSPSLAESFGLTLVESIAAGTPCVVYETSAGSEIVEDGITGFRACPSSVEDLAACIDKILSLPQGERARLRASCRAMAEQKYGMARPASQMVEVFNNLIRARSIHP